MTTDDQPHTGATLSSAPSVEANSAAHSTGRDGSDEALPHGATGGSTSEVQAMLDATRTSVVELLERSRVHPAAVRVAVGEISVEMEWTRGDASISSGAAPTPLTTGSTDPAPTPDAHTTGASLGTTAVPLVAPAVGVFYRAPEPGAAPFVEAGDTVVLGQKVALIEVMKLLIPVEADRHGTIAEIVCENATAVEYGQTVLTVVPLAGGE
ncbi:acetyl-CoA carboxylase biotin carboxyl carrier protein [Salinifilum ghardaiensis]